MASALEAAGRAIQKLELLGERFEGVEDPLEREQWAQALVDLGYCNDDVLAELAESGDGEDERLLVGWQEFRCEWARASTSVGPGAGDIEGGDLFESIEKEVLQQLVSFEGVSHAPEMPREGQRGVWARVLHYRLASLGLYSHAVDAPVGDETRRALHILCWILGGTPDAAETLDLLGNAQALSQRFVDQHGEHPLVVFTGSSEGFEQSHDELLCGAEGFGSLRQVENRFALMGMNEHLRWVEHVRASRRDPNDRHEELANRFGIRLLQLRLWMLGFYPGRLDGSWGPVSAAALAECLETALTDQTQYQPWHAVVNVGNGYLAINPVFSLGKLTSELLAPTPVNDPAQLESAMALVESGALAQLESAMEIESEDITHAPLGTSHVTPLRDEPSVQPLARSGRGNLFQRIRRVLRKGVQAAYTAGRRVYQGMRDLVVRVRDVARRGLEWVQSGIGAVTSAASSTFRYIYTQLGHATRTVREAFGALASFFSGSPIVTWSTDRKSLVWSRWFADADAVVFVSSAASTELLASHAAARLRAARLLTLALEVVGIVLGAAIRLLVGPAGWVKFGVELGRRIVALAKRHAAAPPTLALEDN